LINNLIFDIIFICVYESPSLTNDINKVNRYYFFNYFYLRSWIS